MPLAVGDRVESIAVGVRPAFVGAIESFNREGWNVRADDDNLLWARTRKDLSLVDEDEDEVLTTC